MKEESASYQTGFDEELKGVALRVEAIIKRHQSIVDWHLREDVQRRMRRDIKRALREAGELSEPELDELARNMVDVSRRRAWMADRGSYRYGTTTIEYTVDA